MLGTSLWMVVRLTIVSAAFVIVMVIFGATDILRGIAMLPVAVLTGLAFALPIMAYTATRRGDASFPAINRFIITPLFLFSGMFFPVTELPTFLQPIAFADAALERRVARPGIAIGTIDAPLARSTWRSSLALYARSGRRGRAGPSRAGWCSSHGHGRTLVPIPMPMGGRAPCGSWNAT